MTLEPLKLHPCYKEYLWGGTLLKTKYRKADAPDVTAESWELADHRDGVSTVDGKTLRQLGEANGDAFLGSGCPGGTLPILVKLIDAAKDLSIQVHPSDRTARSAAGEQGKAEMWYVVDCKPQAFIYYGFNRRISKEEFLRRAGNGTITEVLNRVPVSRGDVFYILPGTIHAIGAGIMIAEIQQNSNTTFRVYDYRRRDASGQLRELHLERAAEVLDFTPVVPADCKVNCIMRTPDFTMSEMFSCPYFRAYRVDVRRTARLCCDGKSFQHILCVEGNGMIVAGSRAYPLSRGDSYFMPAAIGSYQINGECRVLLSRL